MAAAASKMAGAKKALCQAAGGWEHEAGGGQAGKGGGQKTAEHVTGSPPGEDGTTFTLTERGGENNKDR